MAVFNTCIVSIYNRVLDKELKVTISKPAQCMLGNDHRTIHVRPSAANGGPTFRKDGKDIALMWPEA